MLKRGQSIIVQVSKEPISTKGPRVTAQVSIAGRFVVFMPFASRVGVSRKIGERAERQRLREQVQKVLPKNSGGVIVRTVGEDVTQQTFETEITTLIGQWSKINKKTKFVGSPPKLLHRETSLTRGIIRDLFSEKIDKLTVDSKQIFNEITEYLQGIAPELVDRVMLHEEKVPLQELYAACQSAREMLAGPDTVSRVIARPFTGSPGAFKRTANRKDFSVQPAGRTLLDALAEAGVPRTGIGKVDDLFAGRNIASTHTPTNSDAYRLIKEALLRVDFGLVFVNVIEFDQSWGHRNDVAGFHGGMLELDGALAELLPLVRDDDIVAFTADHGNDPTTPSTDHARENAPLLVFGPKVRPVPLGVRATFADLGQTAAEYFGVKPLAAGTSFLKEIA